MLEAIGGRKMLAALIIISIAVAVVAIKGDVPPNLLNLLEVVFGSFAAANTLNSVGFMIANKPSGSVDEKVATGPAPDGLTIKEAVQAFQDLGAKIDGHAAESKEVTGAIVKSNEVVQKALSVLVERSLQ